MNAWSSFSPKSGRSCLIAIPMVWLALLVLQVNADQVQMQNGDRYIGDVVEVNGVSVTVQSDVLGKLNLPRAKVAIITFGAQAGIVQPAVNTTNTVLKRPLPAATNAFSTELGVNSNLIQRVQRQFLAGADPAAQDKFNELVSGLLSGRLTVEDIRKEAKSAADQIRALRKDAGQDASWAIDGYLAILDHFVKETPATAKPRTNSPATKPQLLEDE
jgi:hypothetical protein